MSTVRTLIVLLLLTVAYLLLHPAWYGDGAWYALDLQRAAQNALPVDPGHLFWRPLGLGVFRVMQLFLPAADPLWALQFLSALGAAGSVVAVFALMQRIGRGFSESIAAALLLALSHMSVAFGGSGSSYTMAVFFGVAALLPLVHANREWGGSDGLLAAGCLLLSWGMWGVGILLLPLLGVTAALWSDGSVLRRLLRAGALMGVAGFLILGVALGTYWMDVPTPTLAAFPTWYSASGHGIAPAFSGMGIARALLGFVITFVYVGTLGTSFKGLLLRDAEIATFGEMIVPLLTCGVFVAVLGLAAFGAVRVARKREARGRSLLLIVLAALLPVGGFAMLWQGSDVERFSLALPFLCMAVVAGVRAVSERLLPLPVIIAGMSTILLYALPVTLSGGGMVHQLGREARKHLPAGSLVVLIGQRLGAGVWTPMTYFAKLQAHSISYDISVHEAAGWDVRLTQVIDDTLSAGQKVAVLSDLLGQPTPGGVRHSFREYPVPSFQQTAELLSRWRQGAEWSVGEFSFIELESKN